MAPAPQAIIAHRRPVLQLITNRPFCRRRRGIQKPHRKPGFLTLPDKALSKIFKHLIPSKQGTLHNLRHAYSLAQTNTRLLSIFGKQLTHISLNIMNDVPNILSFLHVGSLVRIAGPSLKELHLSHAGCPLLLDVPDLCPNLEKLVVHEEDESGKFVVVNAVQMITLNGKLPSLTVINPLPPTVEMLFLACFSTVGQLSLINISRSCMKELLELIRLPLKKLTVILDEKVKTLPKAFVPAFGEIIPQLEEVCVKAPDAKKWRKLEKNYEDDFYQDALQLLAISRNPASKCRKITLEGNIMQLISQAHPQATVEITRLRQTFVDCGSGIYAKKLPLWNHYLSQDHSRLSQVCVVPNSSDRWRELVRNKHFGHGYIDSTKAAARLGLKYDVVEIPIVEVDHGNWTWLNGAKEVRLMQRYNGKACRLKIKFWESVASLLTQFRGEIVWMEGIADWPTIKKADEFKRAVKGLYQAIDEFEACGGDAEAVRAIVKVFDGNAL